MNERFSGYAPGIDWVARTRYPDLLSGLGPYYTGRSLAGARAWAALVLWRIELVDRGGPYARRAATWMLAAESERRRAERR